MMLTNNLSTRNYVSDIPSIFLRDLMVVGKSLAGGAAFVVGLYILATQPEKVICKTAANPATAQVR
jgi:hypothetical protein